LALTYQERRSVGAASGRLADTGIFGIPLTHLAFPVNSSIPLTMLASGAIDFHGRLSPVWPGRSDASS